MPQKIGSHGKNALRAKQEEKKKDVMKERAKAKEDEIEREVMQWRTDHNKAERTDKLNREELVSCLKEICHVISVPDKFLDGIIKAANKPGRVATELMLMTQSDGFAPAPAPGPAPAPAARFFFHCRTRLPNRFIESSIASPRAT